MKIKTEKSLKILYFLGLSLALAHALPSYIQSSFLENYLSISLLSIFFVVVNLISFFFILFYPHLILKKKNFNLTLKMALLSFLAFFFLSFFERNVWVLFFLFMLYSVTLNLLWINLDLFVEFFTKNKSTGKTRTVFYTFLNFGWVISPVLSAYLVKLNDYKFVFLISALVLIPFIFVLLKNKKILDIEPDFEKIDLKANFLKLFKNKNLRSIFILACFLQIFYSSAVIYIPIYLHEYLGFSWSILGILFTIMLLPFILVEIPAGIIADRYLGEKEILSFGFAILISALFLFYFTNSVNPFVWGTILFMSRIGAALVEAMRETYFFKIVDVKDMTLINLFRTSTPIGYLIGSLIGSIVVYLFSLQDLFLVVALLFLCSFYFVTVLKDTK
ncbi:MAG: MFS transporter [Patescibacteria group bacterium]